MTGARLMLMLGCLAALNGCRREEPLLPVAGKVVVGDRPVREGTVTFQADPGKGNKTMHLPVSAIGPDGSYDLETNGKRGAPPGWYRVKVMADNFRVVDPPPSPVWPHFPEGFLPKPLVHERYLNFNTTDVAVEVLAEPATDAYVLRLNP